MLRALELAKQGEGSVPPNPMVGCVVVKDGRIVGEGYHQRYGGPHAEIYALEAAGKNANGATVYVTLEPCGFTGKTPPCTDALIAAKVAQVVVAMRDPNPRVAGKGIELLQKAGIYVSEGENEEEAKTLNEKYLTPFEKNRPWVIAKWAMTLDGKIASKTGSSQWISSEASRLKAQQLRAQVDAIMIGSGTALLDDPQLMVRLPEKMERPHPLRIVLNDTASIPLKSRLVQTAREVPLLIGIDAAAPLEKVKQLEEAGCELLVLPGRLRMSSLHAESRERERDFRLGTPQNRGEWNETEEKRKKFQSDYEEFQQSTKRLTFLLTELVRRGITSLLLEGGGALLGSFLDAKLIDEVHVFIAPKLLGGKDAVSPMMGIGIAEIGNAMNFNFHAVEKVGPDIYLQGRRGQEMRNEK
ncbi:MAG: bifunctional diaminohydroxyphosphoribosylaminopyrimidine deaminase/5-amino-6-(5-phosphoribosylamino)uracil reductase RibD [Planctomycetaceae bacterium]|nr:bifunctional diaminohydroxyphosphoribosylaminopyrimidine deaminase/5-amino-6-(5-phosphoribosylamino)uracil reductase RibD [Planctomycetaceae bacterium]MCL2306206.1 bifunctional diaminohydroxyphosphoribosylaminopyrimidine deaminase/5-amino-6-(5-phosphoribosylamino)uracil reductase RibD [Planctomycetaceae bacterium]